jgi:hypothetical protein
MSENSFNLAYYLQLSALLHAAKTKLREFLSSLFPPHFTRLLPSLFPFQVWCMNDASFIDGFSFEKLSGLNLTLGALGESPDALQLSSQPRVLPFLYYYSKFLRFFFLYIYIISSILISDFYILLYKFLSFLNNLLYFNFWFLLFIIYLQWSILDFFICFYIFSMLFFSILS